MKKLNQKILKISALLFIIVFTNFTFIKFVKADTVAPVYMPLAPISDKVKPVDFSKGQTALSDYLNGMYQLLVGVAGVLAVIMIMWGGIEYMSTDAIGGKEEAKGRINNALLGLMLALGSYLILKTINTDFLKATIDVPVAGTPGLTAPAGGNGFGPNSNDPNALTTSTGPGSPSGGNSVTPPNQSQIEAEYNKVYAQWTDEDNKLADAGDAGALEKWNGIQFQIDSLDKTYSSSNSGSTQKGSDLGNKIGDVAKNDAGQNLNGSCDKDVGCTHSMTTVLKEAGVNIPIMDGSAAAARFLQTSPDWTNAGNDLSQAKKGDVAYVPGVPGVYGGHGHMYIVGEDGGATMYGNSSDTGKWSQRSYYQASDRASQSKIILYRAN